MNKRVHFSCDVELISTFANEEYDRTAQEVAKLTYKDMLELLTMKSQWKREMKHMLARRDSEEKDEDTTAHIYNPPEICI